MDLLKIVGTKVKLLREEKGINQKVFADKAGITPSYLSAIERGVKNPTLKTWGGIAEALNVPVETLLAKEDKGIELCEAYSKKLEARENLIDDLALRLKKLKTRDLELLDALMQRMEQKEE